MLHFINQRWAELREAIEVSAESLAWVRHDLDSPGETPAPGRPAHASVGHRQAALSGACPTP
jgi:hypothetical protein